MAKVSLTKFVYVFTSLIYLSIIMGSNTALATGRTDVEEQYDLKLKITPNESTENLKAEEHGRVNLCNLLQKENLTCLFAGNT